MKIEARQITQLWFKCPGCMLIHGIQVKPEDFNGDQDNPTVTAPHGFIFNKGTEQQCQIETIDNGDIQYGTYSMHHLAGSWAPMLEITENDYGPTRTETNTNGHP